MSKRITRSAQAFTLVELLVVIAIIGVLVGILVPVVSKMRQAGYKTDTANQINVIRSAIDLYHQTFQAYPGPVSDDDIHNTRRKADTVTRMTMAENLVIGLLGGFAPGTANDLPIYNPDLIGTGPRSLNRANPNRYEPFLKQHNGMLTDGRFMEPGRRMPCQDSDIPEFLDRYPAEPMPILYLRARRGAPGIISRGDRPYQYDLRQILPYTSGNIYGRDQGLRSVGNDMAAELVKGINDEALPYFKNPNLCPPGSDQLLGTPRAKDSYILISAGQDRIYGTLDDITSFGSVAE